MHEVALRNRALSARLRTISFVAGAQQWLTCNVGPRPAAIWLTGPAEIHAGR